MAVLSIPLVLAIVAGPASLLDNVQVMPLWLHTLAEFFSVVVAMLIFALAWNAYSNKRAGNVLLLASAFLAVGLLDLLHLMSFRGMPDFVTPAGPEKAINFWLSARLLAALAMLAVAVRPWRPLRDPRAPGQMLFAALALSGVIGWLGLAYPDSWPDTFVPGEGLTPIKVVAEFVIIAILAIAAVLFFRDARRDVPYDAASFFAVAVIGILSEFCFTLYTGVTDVFNLLGHLLKIVAYLYLYRAVFVDLVQEPFERLNAEVAERLQAQRELQELNQTLEQRIAERTHQLQLANRELEAFSYSVSHDLRSPLNVIEGFCTILDKKLEGKLDEENAGYLARIRGAAARMKELIEALLGLARFSRGELMRRDVDLTALAQSVADELRDAPGARAVEFIIQPGMHMHADGQLLRVVMQNLIGNAWKFTGKVETPRIEVGLAETRHGQAVFVRDNGPGFDMAFADKLFVPFQRLHSVRDFPGSGIGLATVFRIISRHHGHVWAEAAEGQGATFYFTCGEAPA